MIGTHPLPPKDRLAAAHLFLVGKGGDGLALLEGWLAELTIASTDQNWLTGDGKLTIEQVREFQRLMLLAPLASPWRVGLIPQAHTLTHEAATALLKILEDPPMHGLFLLVAEHEDQLLPTVISRCQRWKIRRPGTGGSTLSNTLDIDSLRKQTYGERFRIAEEWAKSDHFLENFDQLLVAAHTAFREHRLTAEIMEDLLQYRSLADTNVSERLLAETALLALGKE